MRAIAHLDRIRCLGVRRRPTGRRNQHGHVRPAQQTLGCRSEHHAFEAGDRSVADDDEIGALLARDVEHDVHFGSGDDVQLRRTFRRGPFVPDQPAQLGSRRRGEIDATAAGSGIQQRVLDEEDVRLGTGSAGQPRGKDKCRVRRVREIDRSEDDSRRNHAASMSRETATCVAGIIWLLQGRS